MNDKSVAKTGNRINARSSLKKDARYDRSTVGNDGSVIGNDRLAARND